MDDSPRPIRLAPPLALVLVPGLLLPGAAEAQERTFRACYVPEVGAVYLIGEEGLPPECLGEAHVEFSWSEGGGVSEHGELEGLDGDDHPQYLHVDGRRAMSGALDMGDNRVVNLSEATDAGEAVPFEQALTTGEEAGGDLAGSLPDPEVAGLRGRAVAAEDPESNDVLAWDFRAREWRPMSAASATEHGQLEGLDDDDHPQYVREGEGAEGDLGGTYPDPTVEGLQGRAVSELGPQDEEVLGWDASSDQWQPMTVLEGTDHGQLDDLDDDDHPEYVREGEAAGGDLGGTYPDPTVTGLRGNAVATASPADGQVLAWDAGAGEYAPTSASPVEGSDHGELAGLGDDDHTRYLLAEGVRNVTDGFAVSGTFGSGSIPTSGSGTRLMWHPAKAAFRAGKVFGAEWDDTNVGNHSVAFGSNTTASGDESAAMGRETTASGQDATAMGGSTTASGSQSTAMGEGSTASGNESTAMGSFSTASGGATTAMGDNTTASGEHSTAMGLSTTASGDQSTAMGRETTASGHRSTAMGWETTASGNLSTAMGNTIASGGGSTAMGFQTIASGVESTAMGSEASTNGHQGSFVYGDASTDIDLEATADDQFVVRAQHIWLGTDNGVNDPAVDTDHFLSTSTGAYLSTNGVWTDNSSRSSKENLRAVDPGAVLEKVADLPVRRWNYRGASPEVEHIGPTAEDFHAAFGLGADAKHIASLDVGGVSLLSIQALEERTREQAGTIEKLRSENAEQRERIQNQRDRIREQSERLDRLEATVERLVESRAGDEEPDGGSR